MKEGVMMDKPKVGDKVHYQPEHYRRRDMHENGVVKEVREDCDDAVWVVFNCGGEWDRYWYYTGAKTNLRDLKKGWKNER